MYYLTLKIKHFLRQLEVLWNRHYRPPTPQNDEKDSYELGAYPCHGFVAASQFFSLSRRYEVRREDNCAEVSV